MDQIKISEVVEFVEANIGGFHTRRSESLKALKLAKVLKRKNPYLFKAKNINDAHDLVKLILDAHLSSQEETVFGEFLEALAIFVCQKVYGGRKSSSEGIDLEFVKDDIVYICAIKSGPNWGNNAQVKRMVSDFKQAIRVLRTSNSRINVRAVNGCCYGRDKNTDKGDYLKLCGQDFWEFISGSDRLYVDIVEPLGYKAKEKNEEFFAEYSRILNLFTKEFMDDFCVDGEIDWNKLVSFNSGRK